LAQGGIQKAGVRVQRAVEKNERIVVGVNDLVAEENSPPFHAPNRCRYRTLQIAKLERSQRQARFDLAQILSRENPARPPTPKKLLPAIIASVESHAQ